MPRKLSPTWLCDEIADFLAAGPSRDEFLTYRPSPPAQQRISTLLDKARQGSLTPDEEWELRQFEFAETLIQAVKARLRTSRSVSQ